MQMYLRISLYIDMFVLVIFQKLNELICYFGPVINNPAEFRDLEAFFFSSCKLQLTVGCFSFCRVSPVALDVFLQHGGATILGSEIFQLFSADLRNDEERTYRSKTTSALSCARTVTRTFSFWKAPEWLFRFPLHDVDAAV